MTPEMMLTEKIIELQSLVKYMLENDIEIRKNFVRVIPGLTIDSSWGNIWERVRDKFDQSKLPEADPNCLLCKGTGKGSVRGSSCDCYWIKETK